MKIINAKGCNDSLTPNKAKRRPGGGNPSPAKKVGGGKLSKMGSLADTIKSYKK